MVQVMSIVDVVESYRRSREDIEIGRVSLSQLLRCVESVHEQRHAASHAIAQAVEELIAWWMLEISDRIVLSL